MSDPIEIKLKHPVLVGGEKTEALRMRGPKVRDLIAAEKYAKMDSEREMALFAALCEVPHDVIESMELLDYMQLQRAYQAFLA